MLIVGISAGTAQSATPLDEIAGARRVCAEGPSAAIARAQRLRGEAAIAAASVLPNPELVVEHQRTIRGPKEQETTVGIAVSLGLGGRRFLLQDAAKARRVQALADARATLFEAALAFREAYAAAALDEARLAVLTSHQRALDTLTGTLAGLAKGGESAGYDRLRQETQARLHRRLLESTRARAEASRALLEAWIGEEVTLASVSLADLAGGQKARATAPQGEQPDVMRLEAAARASGIEAQAARRRWIPDIELFAGYRGVAGAAPETGHGISIGLTVPLTFFDHGQGEAAHAEAEHATAKAMLDHVKRDRQARAKAALVRLQVLESDSSALDRMVTDAAALETQATQLYRAGEASITELLEAFRAAEEARIARLDTAEEIVMARLHLMRALGTLFHPTLDKECSGAGGGVK